MALFSRHHSSELPEVLVSEDGTILSSLLSREIRFTCSGFFDKFRSARYEILELLAPDISPWVPGPSSVR